MLIIHLVSRRREALHKQRHDEAMRSASAPTRLPSSPSRGSADTCLPGLHLRPHSLLTPSLGPTWRSASVPFLQRETPQANGNETSMEIPILPLLTKPHEMMTLPREGGLGRRLGSCDRWAHAVPPAPGSVSAQSGLAPTFCGVLYCFINLLSLFMLFKKRGGPMPFDLEFTRQT